MTEKKDDPFTMPGTEPAAGLETDAVHEEAASEITTTMRAALVAAIGASRKPGLALSALRLAYHALRTAIVEDGLLPEKEVDAAERFADAAAASDSDGTGAALASREIVLRCTRVAASTEQVQRTLGQASTCLEDLIENGCDHPMTQLVVLYAAREMALALLKYQHPDDHEEMLCTLRGMENAVKPGAIEVIPMPATHHMSKGGDA